MLTYPQIDPVALHLGPLRVHWYGIMYVLGFGIAWWLARRRAAQPGSRWTPVDVDDLIYWAMLGVILGGRLGYVLFYGTGFWALDPFYPFKIWEGGMSFHGALIGVLASLALLLQVGGCGMLGELPPTLLAPAARLYEVQRIVGGHLAPWLQRAARDHATLAEILRQHPGPVLAENLGPPLLCDREPLVCDPSTYFLLARQGRWDERRLCSMVERQELAVILVQELSPRNIRLPWPFLQRVLEHYEPACRVGVDWVLLPRRPQASQPARALAPPLHP